MTNPLKTEHALDWRKTAQEIEDQFQAGMIERDDLAMLVRQLATSLRKAAPDHSLPAKAIDYLKRKGLQGSVLRSS